MICSAWHWFKVFVVFLSVAVLGHAQTIDLRNDTSIPVSLRYLYTAEFPVVENSGTVRLLSGNSDIDSGWWATVSNYGGSDYSYFFANPEVDPSYLTASIPSPLADLTPAVLNTVEWSGDDYTSGSAVPISNATFNFTIPLPPSPAGVAVFFLDLMPLEIIGAVAGMNIGGAAALAVFAVWLAFRQVRRIIRAFVGA